MEQESISTLLSLLGRTEEAISFVLLLIDYNIGETIAQLVSFSSVYYRFLLNDRCNNEIKALISSITYEELITSDNGIVVSRALVDAVINRQIGLQISVSR